ncbi:hypothetical protein [Butyrivibrio sp. INlla16]|uniref:hypothetical protein n=1 Tax=Butyrivibrio sp. INlla16 TaxID=1520807 RepID=UPI00087EB0C2|nr:hypothetical protein [Butyrivibrio sp. INlla16]SDB66765.1 hypothetical protein SAMN02910263_03876 [Butyrivibrio sp. INlla16]
MKTLMKRHILLDTLILSAAFKILNDLLQAHKLRFRFFVIQVVVTLAVIGIIVGIIQLIRRQNNKKARRLAYIDGMKYSANTSEFLDRFVYYYEYKNFFISGNVLKIMDEYPGFTGPDPIRTVYDENGNGTVVMGRGG